MSYNNSYGKNEYYSGGRGGYDSYHGGSRRGSPRGGGRSYSSRGGGGSNYYQGGGGGGSSRYQGNNSYGGGNGNYNQSNSRNDDSYRTVRYTDSPKNNYRAPPSYDSGSKRPRLDNDSRYGGSSGGSSYKGSSYRHQDSSYNQNYSSNMKRDYEKSKSRDFIYNSNKGSMGPPPAPRYTRGIDRPFRSRGRGRSGGGYLTRKPYGAPAPAFMKSKIMDPRFKRNQILRNSYQVEKLRKLKRIQQIRARRRLAEKGGDWKGKDEDGEKDEMEGSSEEVEEEEEIEEELEDDEGGEEQEADEDEIKEEEDGDKDEDKDGASTTGDKESKPATPKKKKKVVRKVVKVVKKVVKRKKELGTGAKVANGDSTKDGEKDDRVRFKLDCPACKLSCLTYREYTLHLYTSRHMDAMKKLVGTLRAELNQMRNEQREEQKEFEAENKGEGLSTLYCEMCKLNYRQLKSEHMRSERHKKMREFLIPICKTCHMTCKSQMAYQNHVCSISHLKAAQRLTIAEERRAKYRELRETEGKDVNMDNFMVLDSVGSADEEEDDDTAVTGEDADKKKKKKEVINVGSEYVKKVMAFYCELCRFYLSHNDDNEAEVLSRHCQNRAHMKRYVSARDDLALRKKAEKLHRELEKLNEEEEKEKNAAKKKDGTGDKKDSSAAGADDTSGAALEGEGSGRELEDKVWSEIESLGTLLETDGAKSSDEENEEETSSGGRRYDRFQAGNAISVKKIDIDDLDEKELESELDKKEESEEVLGELGGMEMEVKEEEEKN